MAVQQRNSSRVLCTLLLLCSLLLASAQDLSFLLSKHNEYRARHGVPPLVWNSTLAATAQSYANSCPGGHSGNGYGENLWWGSKGYSGSAAQDSAMTGWYNEVKDYNFASGGFSMATGHFTQLVWKSTTQLGCGYTNACNANAMGGFNFESSIVCNYYPPGNYAGEFQNNVLPAGSNPVSNPPPPADPSPPINNRRVRKASPKPAPKPKPASPKPKPAPKRYPSPKRYPYPKPATPNPATPKPTTPKPYPTTTTGPHKRIATTVSVEITYPSGASETLSSCVRSMPLAGIATSIIPDACKAETFPDRPLAAAVMASAGSGEECLELRPWKLPGKVAGAKCDLVDDRIWANCRVDKPLVSGTRWCMCITSKDEAISSVQMRVGACPKRR